MKNAAVLPEPTPLVDSDSGRILTSLRNCNEIVVGHQSRNRVRLNGSRDTVATQTNVLTHDGVKTGVIELVYQYVSSLEGQTYIGDRLRTLPTLRNDLDVLQASWVSLTRTLGRSYLFNLRPERLMYSERKSISSRSAFAGPMSPYSSFHSYLAAFAVH